MPDADGTQATTINSGLWQDKEVRPKAAFDAVQRWLAIGNPFADNSEEKGQYGHRHVAKAIRDVQGLLGRLMV